MKNIYCTPSLRMVFFCADDILTISPTGTDTVVGFNFDWIDNGGGFEK